MLKVEDLSKIYRYKAPGFVTDTLQNVIHDALSKITKQHRKVAKREFYALRDINFHIKKGECVGLIGANGSGKSTLLKILARITFPSKGCISIYGRVGALLEVGAGFNQDLTGRENIYLVGAMLGMTIKEVGIKFDQIVDFALIEKFLDTQVKHYSSGMQVRLAFSIAANYEPEVLLLDEILAVGDIEFQERSLKKISELKGRGVTILFVTHDLEKMVQICPRAIWLEKGNQIMDGPTAVVRSEYLKKVNSKKLRDEVC